MRKFLIAGNWKMNAGPAEAKQLSEGLVQAWKEKTFSCDALLCPPFVSIPFVVKSFRNTPFQTGAQNVHTEDNGAFTGEISTEMLTELTCSSVIVGHSERREYFAETDSVVAAKAARVIQKGMTAIVCVGEQLDQRKNGTHQDVVRTQVEAVLRSLTPQQYTSLVIAYEPVWAIGTGETATPEQAQEMHAFIRSLIRDQWNDQAADSVRVLYGGSMKPANAEELLSRPDVDGGLIGGASLKVESFSEIISIAESINK